MTTEAIEFHPGNVKEATKGLKSADLWAVPYADLYVQPGFNVREEDDEYEAHIENLANLIHANGYDRTKPMAGYVALIGGISRVVITDGHSRHKAIARAIARGAEIETVPVVTAPRGTSMEDLIVGLATSNSGKPLRPYELGTVCKRLVSAGWEPDQISSKLSVTTGYVNDLLLLQSASKQIRDWVRSGKIAAGLAIATLKKHGPKAGAVLQRALEDALAQGKTKASRKNLAPDFAKEVKKNGAKLYEGLMWVKEDAGWSKLSKDTREFLQSIIDSLPPEPKKAAE